MVLAALFIAAEHNADGPLPEPGRFQGLDDVERDDNAAFHVQASGAVGLSRFIDTERGRAKLALAEYGIVVSAQKYRLAGTVRADHTGENLGCLGIGPVEGTADTCLRKNPAQMLRNRVHGFQLIGLSLQINQCFPLLQNLLTVGVNV